VELLKEFKEEYMKFEKERQELANAEKLFGIPITSYPVLMSMEQELKGLEQIFSIYERQQVTVWGWRFSLAFVCFPRVKLFRFFLIRSIGRKRPLLRPYVPYFMISPSSPGCP
jgi:hypothetical protein